MSTLSEPTQRAIRIDGALSARAVLDHFNERGRALLGPSQADAAARIAQVLAHEADLSAAWGGLPGTDHPRHWKADVGDEAAVSDARSEHRRLDVHLPAWWTLPLTLRDRGPHRVAFPFAGSRAALAELVRRHMPGGWWSSTVHVTLDVETRVYWGARGAVHPHAAGRHACAQRGDAARATLPLMTLASGRAVETALPERPVDPDVVLELHPGVGWLVAVPMLRFEREPNASERLQMRIARWWRGLRARAGQPTDSDRDPTFAARLAADEAWWAQQLGVAPLTGAAADREVHLGAALRPASRPALQPAPARTEAQVILIHGGLSSARSGFEAALNTAARAVAKAVEAHEARLDADTVTRTCIERDAAARAGVDAGAFAGAATARDAGRDDAAAETRARVDALEMEGAPSASRPMPARLRAAASAAAMAATAAAYDIASQADAAAARTMPALPSGIWPGLPSLDARPTWRFEHDTFLGIARNVRDLVAAVRRQCVADAPAGPSRHVVLVAHSRGGNVARFALPLLRKHFGKLGWSFAAVTLGSPHLGTHVFERVGHRWHGLATAVGGLRHLGAPWMNRESLAELVNLERGLAYDVPSGFHDVEPAGVLRMMRGKPATELPPGMWLVGSHWGPGSGLEERAWDWLFEDMMGAEDEGDGLVQRHSALGGRAPGNDPASGALDSCPVQFDASPVFHTHYLVHEATRAQVARMLAQALGVAPVEATRTVLEPATKDTNP